MPSRKAVARRHSTIELKPLLLANASKIALLQNVDFVYEPVFEDVVKCDLFSHRNTLPENGAFSNSHEVEDKELAEEAAHIMYHGFLVRGGLGLHFC
jgi:hypothetical protein